MAKFTVLGAYLDTGAPAEIRVDAPNAMAAQEIANRDYRIAVSTVDIESEEDRIVRQIRARSEAYDRLEGPVPAPQFAWRRIGGRVLIVGVCITVPGLCFPPLIAVGGVLFWAGLIMWTIGIAKGGQQPATTAPSGPACFSGWEGLRFFEATCADPATERVFDLRLIGADGREAVGVAEAWGFVVKAITETRPRPSKRTGMIRVRLGGRYDAGEAGEANLLDIDAMLDVLQVDCDPIDRNIILHALIRRAYGLRDSRPDALRVAEQACWQWFMEAPVILRAIGRERGTKEGLATVGTSPADRLAILLEKAGHLARAAEVCRVAAALPLSKAEIEDLRGRLARLDKRITKR